MLSLTSAPILSKNNILSIKNITSLLVFLLITSLSPHSESGKKIQNKKKLMEEVSALLLAFLKNTELPINFSEEMHKYIDEDEIKNIRKYIKKSENSDNGYPPLDTTPDDGYKSIVNYFKEYGEKHIYNTEIKKELNNFLDTFNSFLSSVNAKKKPPYSHIDIKGEEINGTKQSNFFNIPTTIGKITRGFIILE